MESENEFLRGLPEDDFDNDIYDSIIDSNTQLLKKALSRLPKGERLSLVNRVDFYGNTFLGLACNNESSDDILNLLIKNGASANKADFYGQTPLQYACQAENINIIDLLIKAGADVNFIQQRYAALHTAAFVGNEVILQKLIASGADPNILTKRGVTPLHCAIESGNLACAKILLESGAYADVPHHLKRKCKSSAASEPVLVLATELGNVDAVRMLLNAGARPDSMGYFGITALNVSCNRHFNGITKMLLQHGSDANIPDENGLLPLHYAAGCGDLELVQMILSKEGPKNVLDKRGESPLSSALRSQNVEVIKLLLENGFCPNLFNPAIKDSRPPILRAAASFTEPMKFEEALVALMKSGCDINAYVPRTFETALFEAIDLEKNSIAKVLLKYNARTDVECPHSLTIFNMACQRNLVDVVEMMCKIGVDLNKEGWLLRGGNWTCITARELGRMFCETPDPSVPTIFWNKMSLYRTIRSYLFNVQPLQSLCRYLVRKLIQDKFLENVGRLDLPATVKNYLLLGNERF